MSIQEITTRIKPFDSLTKVALATQWQNLEKRADCSVFLSWLWIEPWLEQMVGNLFIIEAYQNKQVVGLGVFVEKKKKVFGLFPIKQWHLHRSGNAQQDQIWIEYNDFLLASNIADKVRTIMVKALYSHNNQFQEIVIGLSSAKVLNCFHQYFSQSNILIESLGYVVDLSAIEKSYLHEVPSKNARSQINRSNKALSQLGDLAFKVVIHKDEIMALYKDIAKIHIERWENTDEGSGFSNREFIAFHQQLIKNDAANTVQISVLLLNNSPIGYLVNFIYNRRVYFYLSALITFNNNKIKVGLTLHEKAINYYVQQGMMSYDFLGGKARYKDSLSNSQYSLDIKSFYRNSFVLTTEKRLKTIKSRFKLLLSKYMG